MSHKLHPVSPEWAASAWIDKKAYRSLYDRSISDPNGFWGEVGRRIDWVKPYSRVKNTSFDPHNVSIKWFEDGTLNVSANCIDRHLATRGDQVAIIWESDDPSRDEKITYRATARARLPLRQRLEGARRQQGRPRRRSTCR